MTIQNLIYGIPRKQAELESVDSFIIFTSNNVLKTQKATVFYKLGVSKSALVLSTVTWP